MALSSYGNARVLKPESIVTRSSAIFTVNKSATQFKLEKSDYMISLVPLKKPTEFEHLSHSSISERLRTNFDCAMHTRSLHSRASGSV